MSPEKVNPDLACLQKIESAATLALGLLWMTERHDAKAHAAYTALRDALGGRAGLSKAIQAAQVAGFEADHPAGASWWAGKKG